MKKFINSFAEDKYYSDMEEKIRALEEKLLDARKECDFHQENYWRKKEELGEKLRIANMKIDSLEDDIVHATGMIQERDEKLRVATEYLHRIMHDSDCDPPSMANEVLTKIKAP